MLDYRVFLLEMCCYLNANIFKGVYKYMKQLIVIIIMMMMIKLLELL